MMLHDMMKFGWLLVFENEEIRWLDVIFDAIYI